LSALQGIISCTTAGPRFVEISRAVVFFYFLKEIRTGEINSNSNLKIEFKIGLQLVSQQSTITNQLLLCFYGLIRIALPFLYALLREETVHRVW